MRGFTPIVNWSAKLLGLAMFLFVGAFVVGEGPPPLVGTFAGFFVSWIGLIALWRWKLVGGLMVVVGMAAFLLATSTVPNFWFMLWMVPGILAIASSWLDSRAERNEVSYQAT